MLYKAFVSTGQFYLGTSGLVLPFPKKAFPPPYQQSSRLHYYATLFNSLEVNSSFYKIPRLVTIKKWAADVPKHFVFSFKLWKGITHVKELEFSKEDIKLFMLAIAGVNEKKGCLLIQFPPKIKPGYAKKVWQLIDHIKHIDDSWRIAVEFRDADWYKASTYKRLAQYGATLVMHDIPKSSVREIEPSAAFVYLRYHGPGGTYRGTYTSSFLLTEAKKIHAWLNSSHTVFAYFNNTIGDALSNAQTLGKYW